MKLRLSLANKISMTIIVVGIFGVLLVYYISTSYKQLSYRHHSQAIQQLAYLEKDDLVEELKANSLDLALAIKKNRNFKQNLKYKDEITQVLDNQFYQYFVTAGVLKLLKLYVLNTDFTLISTSTEGVATDLDAEIICPKLSRSALNRHGSEKLQTKSTTCLYKSHPVFAMIVPFGGLNPKGYIQIVTDLAYNLRKIDQSLAMPIQMTLLNGQTVYQSENWQTMYNDNFLELMLPIKNDDNKVILNISLKSDMSNFNREIQEHRNWVMALAFCSTTFAVFIVLLLLHRSTIPPLARIHDALERIHQDSHSTSSKNQLLFEHLLEQIILLRKKYKTSFSIMLIDLNEFKSVNHNYGEAIGDKLLLAIEARLSSTLRDSDLISWIGTDSPGHKLLPSDSQTQYRATIARLGGDEFGLLLPSAHTEEQAINVAQRIIRIFDETFEVDEHLIDIKCKIGISIYPKDGEDEKQLIRNADKAMHQAKEKKLAFSIFQG